MHIMMDPFFVVPILSGNGHFGDLGDSQLFVDSAAFNVPSSIDLVS